MSIIPPSFAAPRLVPPGLCTLLDPEVVWLHLASDVATGLAYFSIPAALIVFAMRRRDLAYPWIIGLFALFIIACGATHLVHAWAMFSPAYVTEGVVKAICAAVSVATAVTLWPLLPKLLALPSPAVLEREVEERRAAEARARSSEARMAAFIDHLAEALFVVRVLPEETPQGRFVTESVNPAYERLFGVPAASVVGHFAEQAIPPSVLALVLPRWRDAAERGAPIEYTVEAETPLGHRSWHTVLVPMADADGRVERLLGSARDVTETRRLQAGLVQSARLATIGTMCAGLAHETSQPLNAALLWLRHARGAASGVAAENVARLQTSLGVVEGQLRRAGDLVGRIRGLAGGDSTAEVTRFDARKVIADTVGTAAGQYAPSGIQVDLEASDGELPVQGVAGRLEQAVLHLLSNARDAVLDRRARDPAAPAIIQVLLRPQGREAVLEVRDTGPGVPDTLRDTIFDPFFTTKDPGQGSGLGLSLAAAVARGLGGRLEARNLAEGGACFTMSFPLAPRAAPGPLAVSVVP